MKLACPALKEKIICISSAYLQQNKNQSEHLILYFLYSKCVYLPTPSHRQKVTSGQFLSGVFIGLNSEFSFSLTGCVTKVKEPSLPYYLPIDEGRIIGLIPFPRVLVLREMQSISSKI